ncbi:MAG: class I SAM-dependent methyltransferase [Bacteroidia bacterium]|nr:class I SAM-dependent methyltransferase [Bacteroidia bacterium]
MNHDLQAYYDERAAEYDKLYLNPLEQDDLLKAEKIFQQIFMGMAVLEFACGTGYWSEKIAQSAKSVLATDINQSVINIALKKRKSNTLTYKLADMYSFQSKQKFDAFFGGFIWSHIKIQDLDSFITKIQSLISSKGKFVFIDSNPAEHTHHAPQSISKIDDQGNTYQLRQLENGKEYMVLKNFPDEAFLQKKLSTIANEIQIVQLHHYWIAYGELI